MMSPLVEVASLCALMMWVLPFSKFKVAWSVFLSILFSFEIRVNNAKNKSKIFNNKNALLVILPFYDGFMELNHRAYLLEHFKDILQLAVQILHSLWDLRLFPLFETNLSVSLLLSLISTAPSFYVTVIII